MNKYIAAIDFGTQQVRVAVDCDGKIVFEENFLFSIVRQSVARMDGKYTLSKSGIKRIIAEPSVLKELERKPSVYYQDFFNRLYNTISNKVGGPLFGAIVLVPELYAEIQRFTLKDILEKAGFQAVKILNYSKVCTESLNLNNTSVSEVISVGADYFSLSFIKHEAGKTRPFDMETVAGKAGYYLDELLFNRMTDEMGINQLAQDDQIDEVLLSMVKNIENLKQSVFTKSEPVVVDYSAYNSSMREISLDKTYLLSCFEPFRSHVTRLQHNLLGRNKHITIDQVVLAGELTRVDVIREMLSIQTDQIIQIEDRNVLKTAIEVGKDELMAAVEDKLKKGSKPAPYQAENKPTTKEMNPGNDKAWLISEKYSQLEQSITQKNNFDKAEELIRDMKQILRDAEARLFYEAAHSFYLNDDFQNAYSQIKKAIDADLNPLTKRLFENIIFKQVSKLQNQGMQREVVRLLKEARELNISETIKEAFTRENQVIIAQNPALNRGSNFTPKKKRRH